MSTRRSLSPAQRNALWRATVGQQPSKDHRTLQALHRKGLLQGIDHRPTAAGAAYFAAPSERSTQGQIFFCASTTYSSATNSATRSGDLTADFMGFREASRTDQQRHPHL